MRVFSWLGIYIFESLTIKNIKTRKTEVSPFLSHGQENDPPPLTECCVGKSPRVCTFVFKTSQWYLKVMLLFWFLEHYKFLPPVCPNWALGTLRVTDSNLIAVIKLNYGFPCIWNLNVPFICFLYLYKSVYYLYNHCFPHLTYGPFKTLIRIHFHHCTFVNNT